VIETPPSELPEAAALADKHGVIDIDCATRVSLNIKY
jgi:hypothetical protein